MKVAHVSSQLCRASAGLGAAVTALSAATQSAGNDVRVFGLSTPGWQAADAALWAGAPATVFETRCWSGPLGYAPEMLQALRDFAPDLVHVHGLWTYPSLAAHRWHRETGRPYVVSAHGMLMPTSLSYKPGRKTIARRLFQDAVLRGAGVLHATSEDEAAAYRGLGFQNRLVCIPLGLQANPVPEVGRNSPRRRLLFLGRLHHEKGIDWLIEAWLHLERDFPDWDLSVVGPQDPGYTKEMARLEQLASGKRVTFVGPLYGEAKDLYVAGSDLFTMPSRSENFGLTAAESLVMEVPVIATKGTPWSGLTSMEAGWWIDPGAQALEAALRMAMTLPRSDLHRKGQNGRRWIETAFSWTASGRKWQSVYESLTAPAIHDP